MTTVRAGEALAPLRRTLAAMRALPHLPPMRGLAPGLTVSDPESEPARSEPASSGMAGPESARSESVSSELPSSEPDDPRWPWTPATQLADGTGLPDLLGTAAEHWRASPAAAAALAWKHYTYWLALPAVLSYATARRVPLLRPADIVVHWQTGTPFLQIGLRQVEVAVAAGDPLATEPDVTVVPGTALPGVLADSLLAGHLEPVLARIREQVHIGRRTLLGSLASGVAYGLARAAPVLPDPPIELARTLLEALGVADLVELREPAAGMLAIRRRTCCLAFTLPEPTICPDCCIH